MRSVISDHVFETGDGRLRIVQRSRWRAAVVVDEAQMFAPAAACEMAEDTRRMTLSAMTSPTAWMSPVLTLRMNSRWAARAISSSAR